METAALSVLSIMQCDFCDKGPQILQWMLGIKVD